MKKFLILCIGLLLSALLQGTIITVDIEGAGDYQTIQAGINASVNGDTVLVYPGRYYENTDFIGKTIALASLELTTGNQDYIRSTIIDGNQTGSCVAVCNEEEAGSIVRGFTMTNGIGYMFEGYRGGGGIFLYEASLDIVNCIVENNEAFSGGGINVLDAHAYLEGVTIRYNEAAFSGGGIYSGCLPSSITYSYDNRCNIYDNFSIRGLDFCNRLENGIVTDVVVDTFTVYDPWRYEFFQGEGDGEQIYDESVFDMQHAKYERVYSDLYVSPNGNDENSGLSPEEPLQTLNQALHFITACEDHPLSVHLAGGIYSTELNNQKFPITLRSFVSIIGESVENTIIELNGIDQGFAIDISSDLGYVVRNLTIRDGYANNLGNIYSRIFTIDCIYSNNTAILENLRIIDNNFEQVCLVNTINLIMRNIIFDNNIYYPNCEILHNYMNYSNYDCTVLMEYCKISGNHSGSLNLDAAIDNQENPVFNIVNCEFSDNSYYNNFTGYTMGISIFAHDDQKINIVNSTFTANTFDGFFVENALLKLQYGLDVEIMNSILYDNDTSNSIILEGNSTFGIPVVDVHHSIIENGYDSVFFDGPGVLNWDEDTISDRDPLFRHGGEYPYKLQGDSPAIDMGTLDLPEGIELPEYDLAGNPRIMGNGIDLGAYEYNPFSNPVTNNELEIKKLSYYPNPVRVTESRGVVLINYPLNRNEKKHELEIFNIKGQRIWSRELEPGYSEIRWNCCDDQGNKVAAGVYFLRVAKDGEYLEQVKLTVIK